MLSLSKLGQRICIIGCSSSGKSTLAKALGNKLNLPVYHLDQYAHVENSSWIRQSDQILIEQHNQIIKQDKRIINGNYSVCLTQRLANADAVIWLDPNGYQAIGHYVKRCIKNNPNRAGRLSGAENEFKFWLVKWILFQYPKNRIKYQNLLAKQSNLITLKIDSMTSLKKYYQFWQLKID